MTNRDQLDAFVTREPFRPFWIELSSGRRIRVTRDAEVFSPKIHPNRFYVFTEDGATHYFELEAIQSIIE